MRGQVGFVTLKPFTIALSMFLGFMLFSSPVIFGATFHSGIFQTETVTSYFSQTLTTSTFTDDQGTWARVCGNVPWNDSISAHCGNISMPEFAGLPDQVLALLGGMLGIGLFMVWLRRTRGKG